MSSLRRMMGICVAALIGLACVQAQAQAQSPDSIWEDAVYVPPEELEAADIPEPLGACPRKLERHLTSVFENSKLEPKYCYTENLPDHRGYTGGNGFTSATGDMLELVKQYTKQYKDNDLARFLPELERLHKIYNGDVKLTKKQRSDADNKKIPDDDPRARYRPSYIGTLKRMGFQQAWNKECQKDVFKKMQDSVYDQTIYKPAMKYAKKACLKTPLAKVAITEALNELGDGAEDRDSWKRKAVKELGGCNKIIDDARNPQIPEAKKSRLGRFSDEQSAQIGEYCDSVFILMARTSKLAGGTPCGKNQEFEKKWLAAFLKERQETLKSSANRPSAKQYSESWERAQLMLALFEQLRRTDNVTMSKPFQFRFKWGDDSFVVGCPEPARGSAPAMAPQEDSKVER